MQFGSMEVEQTEMCLSSYTWKQATNLINLILFMKMKNKQAYIKILKWYQKHKWYYVKVQISDKASNVQL